MQSVVIKKIGDRELFLEECYVDEYDGIKLLIVSISAFFSVVFLSIAFYVNNMIYGDVYCILVACCFTACVFIGIYFAEGAFSNSILTKSVPAYSVYTSKPGLDTILIRKTSPETDQSEICKAAHRHELEYLKEQREKEEQIEKLSAIARGCK